MSIEEPKLTSLDLLRSTPSLLDLDAKNLFTGEYAGLYNANLSGNFGNLKPLKTYEQYIREHNAPELAESLIRESNPANVAEVNAIIAEYNSALPRIIAESNAQLGQEILDRLTQVFRRK